MEIEHSGPHVRNELQVMQNGSNCIQTDGYFSVSVTSALSGLDFRHSWQQQQILPRLQEGETGL